MSYSCLPNVKQIITTHNKNVIEKLNSKPETASTNCNCRKKDECPIRGTCTTENVVYQATVVEEGGTHTETYIGQTKNSFKKRYTLHKSTFKSPKTKNSTTLSSYIWSLKEKNKTFDITWKILSQAKKLESPLDNCDLCATEKLLILSPNFGSSLNKHSEILGSCRHRTGLYLNTVRKKIRSRARRSETNNWSSH